MKFISLPVHRVDTKLFLLLCLELHMIQSNTGRKGMQTEGLYTSMDVWYNSCFLVLAPEYTPQEYRGVFKDHLRRFES